MRELRTAVMIRVEASWEESGGGLRTIVARMEDRSLSGACIRTGIPIHVGTRVRVHWRFDQFSGVSKYCRVDGFEYVVGLLREKDQALTALPTQIIQTGPEVRPAISTVKPSALADPGQSKRESLPMLKEDIAEQISPIPGKVKRGPGRQGSELSDGPLLRGMIAQSGRGVYGGGWLRVARPAELEARQRIAVRTRQLLDGRQVRKEKKSMAHKWLELSPWRNKENAEASAGEKGDGKANDAGGAAVSQWRNSPPEQARETMPNLEAELLPLEDIYRAAGIMNPPRGYGIRKVVDMLQSRHLQGLSAEMKRAAVMMALEAASVPLEQLQADAKVRQEALDRYEAEQTKQMQAERARKEEENLQIEADLVRTKAHYMARISRNLEGMALEKATFEKWLAIKKREAESISEAVGLCVKAASPGPTSTPLSSAVAAGTTAKQV
jgi:hypothetical protein